MTAPTLEEALSSLGFTHEPAPEHHGKRRIVRVADGEVVGVMSASDAWEWVHEREKEGTR